MQKGGSPPRAFKGRGFIACVNPGRKANMAPARISVMPVARSRPLTSTCSASVMRRGNRTSPERQGQFLRAIPAHSTAWRPSSGHCAFPGWHARREVWHATTMQGRFPVGTRSVDGMCDGSQSAAPRTGFPRQRQACLRARAFLPRALTALAGDEKVILPPEGV